MKHVSGRGLHPENNSGRLQMEKRTSVVGFKWRTVVGFAKRTTVVSFRWRTTALGNRRRTVLCFKWRTLVLRPLLQVNNYSGWLKMKKSGGLRPENDGGELQMENYNNGL